MGVPREEKDPKEAMVSMKKLEATSVEREPRRIMLAIDTRNMKSTMIEESKQNMTEALFDFILVFGYIHTMTRVCDICTFSFPAIISMNGICLFVGKLDTNNYHNQNKKKKKKKKKK